MAIAQFKVTATSLNLRSAAKVDSTNLISVLPKGQIVTKLDVAADQAWWKVSTELQGKHLKGFVANQFLAPVVLDLFNLPEPSDGERIETLTLWATYYNVHTAQDGSGSNPLLDAIGNQLGPKLSDKDWCQAAMEGTVTVLSNDGSPAKTYNYAKKGATQQVNCAPFFPGLSPSVLSGTNSVRFKVSAGAFGEGTAGFLLAPYRTIAVDPARIAIGSVVYVPDARGQNITLSSGDRVTHDGYFFAADVGGAITGNHIDVFLGVATQNLFPWVQSTSSATFMAFLIDNAQTIDVLKGLHQP